jgi:membrane associated rhomboid family serine protease
MFALWMFGRLLENVWGAKRFLLFYLLCGLGAAALHLLFLYIEMEPIMKIFHSMSPEQQAALIDSPDFKVNTATVGASGAIFGCLAAFGYLFPNTMLYIYGAIPIKAKWFVMIYAGLELWLAVQNSAGDNVAHFAHLGGAITGFIIVFIWNKTNRRTLY